MTVYTCCGIVTIFLCVCFGKIFCIDSLDKCKRHWESDHLIVNCSNKGLNQNSRIKEGIPIKHLDLSHNHIREFPKLYAHIDTLTYLDLSNNEIGNVPDDALFGLKSLRVLILANNNIQSYYDIIPSITFQHAYNLKKLSLAGNHLERFSNGKGAPAIVSDSLTELDLSHCGITQVDNGGMPNLEILALSGNRLSNLTSLPSKSLRSLDMSNCSLRRLGETFIEGLPNLEVLNLSWNEGMVLESPSNASVRFEALRRIDMSFCNMRWLWPKFSWMPNVREVILRENMLHSIDAMAFANNRALEVLDLSRNFISDLDVEAFYELHGLNHIDLSHNVINKLDENQFRYNDALESINLSHNLIKNFSPFLSTSLRSVNLSSCIILEMDPDAFSGLPRLTNLDLSDNLIQDLPLNMKSKTLKELDLSKCSLSVIRNTTFYGFPELTSLKLSGNRLTNAFSPSYFKANVFLKQIWLGDNQWHCACHNSTFLAFYEFLTEDPQKLEDKTKLKCFGPIEHYGKTWGGACLSDRKLEIYTTILFLILILFVLGCYSVLIIISCFRKYVRRKSEMRNRQELQENEAELEEISNLNRQILDQEAGQNGSSLFDMMLPSYEAALLMPKPDKTSKSMMNLSTNYNPLSRIINNARSDGEEAVLDQQRFRSEELIFNLEKDRTSHACMFRRMSGTDYNPSRRRHLSSGDSHCPAVHLKHQKLQSAEAMSNIV